jgi:hypothetical protein
MAIKICLYHLKTLKLNSIKELMNE